MRANEFITEEKNGKITKRQGQSTVGVGTFRDKNGIDRTYELNRVMMAAACSDGINDLAANPNAPHSASWAGFDNTYHPYTAEENEMLNQAFAIVGSTYNDLAKGDLKSQELPDTNTKSTVIPFKGYKRK